MSTLQTSGEEHGFDVEGVPLDGGPQVWSSTYVRTCLATGDVAGAAEALGRLFAVRGVVVEGDRRGRELGFFGCADSGYQVRGPQFRGASNRRPTR